MVYVENKQTGARAKSNAFFDSPFTVARGGRRSKHNFDSIYVYDKAGMPVRACSVTHIAAWCSCEELRKQGTSPIRWHCLVAYAEHFRVDCAPVIV